MNTSVIGKLNERLYILIMYQMCNRTATLSTLCYSATRPRVSARVLFGHYLPNDVIGGRTRWIDYTGIKLYWKNTNEKKTFITLHFFQIGAYSWNVNLFKMESIWIQTETYQVMECIGHGICRYCVWLLIDLYVIITAYFLSKYPPFLFWRKLLNL